MTASRKSSPVCKQAVDGAGRRSLPAAEPGPDHRHHGEPHPVPVYLAGHVTGCAEYLGAQLMEKLQQPCRSWLMSPATGRTKGWWRLYVNVDRDSASRLGISMADVDNALYNAFGQRLISTIYTQANQYRVVLEHNTENTPGLAALENIA